MPIEADIPLEIERYQKKFFMGLTLRQLCCLPVALVLAVGTFFLCTAVLGLTPEDSGWVVMLAALPALAVGFVQPRGEPFERFLAMRLRCYLWPSRLCYAARPDILSNAPTQKGGIRHGAHSIPRAGENTVRYRCSGTERKRKRKQTARRIKAAEKEYRQAAAQARREQRAAQRAQRLR